MSQRLFERSLAVTIGSRATGRAIKATGLKVVFQVEKTSESTPNTAKISITNLSADSRAIVLQKDPFVMLEVGYADRLGILYVGDVSRGYVSRQETDRVTTLECGDGHNAVRRASIDRSYAANTDYGTIIRDVAKSLVDEGKVVLGSMIGIESKRAPLGDTLSGMSKDQMDRLAESQGLEWSIQNNTLQVLPKNGALPDEAVLLTPKTGLIGTPVARDTKSGRSGVEFRCLIIPGVAPGRVVQIVMDQDRTVNGFYRIESVNYAGDTHGEAWHGEAVGVSL